MDKKVVIKPRMSVIKCDLQHLDKQHSAYGMQTKLIKKVVKKPNLVFFAQLAVMKPDKYRSCFLTCNFGSSVEQANQPMQLSLLDIADSSS